MSKYRIVFVRHGESVWTSENLFCGWVDIGLTDKGREEAKHAGEALNSERLKFDVAYTSVLTRANDSLEIILKEIEQPELPVTQAWELNERHYGALTGHNKIEMAVKYGKEQVQIWRRSFDVLPPPMGKDHKYYCHIVNNPKLKSIRDKIPQTESLKTTMLRVIPFWNSAIVPNIKSGKRVLIVCHGTSLRGIVKHIDRMSDEAVMNLNLPTGIPFIFEFDADFNPVVSMRFLSDEETVMKAMSKVASIGDVEK
ncbi:Phosphoglycerate mutase 1 [Cryptotermes secundus]|uniref:phosphoglycerate mutase (2,3-diphosphoglycerate-dependent) n=1 Tax=Cryptotermes secundus TaxID=105785 RepID=A0A2J7PQN0_9NEOP|nr:phosphoglycerate mutase 2 [Cryptotermes secundus]XP_023722104.1 phosphoglycerate mutase 2 [Cryptotermes secundus]XP_023722105.1 phosphoglycerate mutase 2 [Cryptotermes secundus]XP_033610587.1 phosphoglycerate mutase 2 [Cryptotermes secundus]PNF18643.1 Phosphoglycerate mutase 1 [Cryptotermes secundus]